MALVSHSEFAGIGAAAQETGLVARAQAVFQTWQRRIRERMELSHMSERELLDMGISRVDALIESGKPFWRS
ncbi:MAG TPA: DUF1127 domain-containing protein [Candidatus Sulfotelmatobacter sp.]|nr:DUF1127 domain-containing protein [Candidatus Sulfotelmatobacter sp.]